MGLQQPGKTGNKMDKSFFGKCFHIGESKGIPLLPVGIYSALGIVWFLLSVKTLDLLVRYKELLAYRDKIEGWIYLIITGTLIAILGYVSFKNKEPDESDTGMTREDMTKSLRKEYEQKLYQLAYHDHLTGLQNRRSLNESVQELFKEKENRKSALFFVDIDDFKYINDTMGHTFGDQFLIRASERLVSLLGKDCSAYKLGGDEFILLMDSFKNIKEVEGFASDLLKGFKACFEIGSSKLYTTVSIGISIYPHHGADMDELLKNAEIAVYKAKEAGKNRSVIYNDSMNGAVIDRMVIEKCLRTALENNEFELHYQPQLDINTSKISGFEALIRWRNPELGAVSPLKFVDVAEATHLIIPIGEWVVKNACIFLKKLHQQEYKDITISVNISILQLLQDDFVDMVMEVLDSVKLDPGYLELEITESILMESYETIGDKLKLLRGKGVKIALDDFGKGYSSLYYLKQLPITTLKIDKSFIDTIAADSSNKSLIRLIVEIGRNMDLCVVAEGVETREQLDYLAKHKCDKIQGYLFSRPMPENQIYTLMKEY